MKNETEQTRYQSYLLRLWQVNDFGVPQTRITLIHVATGQKHTFTEFDALLNFLNQSPTEPSKRPAR
ncbi:hypothetical protein [Candidatus Leptofilum sp.]|uniref:hypothetical protein n=1 Tax=Candidatus Leptofilum sp. TaxID=3241576 RepID=UPI003B5B3FFA